MASLEAGDRSALEGNSPVEGIPVELQAKRHPLTEAGYQQAMENYTDLCVFIQEGPKINVQEWSNALPPPRRMPRAVPRAHFRPMHQELLCQMGGKILRKGQLMPFTFWYARLGWKTYAGLDGLLEVLLQQTWLLWPEESSSVQVWKGRISLRRMAKRRRSPKWFLARSGRFEGKQLVKFFGAKYVEPKEFGRLLLYARRSLLMTSEILGLAVRRLGRMRMWQVAFLLLNSAELQVDTAPYVSAVDACRTIERWDLALEWLTAAKQQNLPATNVSNAASAAILRCRGQAGWPQMLQLLMKLLDVPPSADQISFGTVLSACSESQSWELAIQLVQLMQASQVLPDLVPLASAATACNRADTMFAWRWSLHLFTLARWVGHTPNLRLHNCAISAASRLPGGNWPLAMLQLQEIFEARLQADRVSFSTACAACQRSAAVDQAFRLLKELPKSKVQACALFYSTLVMTGVKVLRWQEAAAYLPQLKSSMKTREAFLGSMAARRGTLHRFKAVLW
ncbi:Pentatricopeptide repeat-containing protein At2g31400 [Durusdinium trenchii]|uniref:Chloroplastic n=1 Tax=Durusdinium trenchii TaxID=1381693 RepID=A0ABP0HZ41_9DINO